MAKSGIVLLKAFFGSKMNQTLQDFKGECDQLSPAEKLELQNMIQARDKSLDQVQGISIN